MILKILYGIIESKDDNKLSLSVPGVKEIEFNTVASFLVLVIEVKSIIRKIRGKVIENSWPSDNSKTKNDRNNKLSI
jgi:hypothetical protein